MQLQILRVQEAEDGLTLANLQQQRAALQVDTYQGFLDAGMNEWEQNLLERLPGGYPSTYCPGRTRRNHHYRSSDDHCR